MIAEFAKEGLIADSANTSILCLHPLPPISPVAVVQAYSEMRVQSVAILLGYDEPVLPARTFLSDNTELVQRDC